jgi:hypothetical protein
MIAVRALICSTENSSLTAMIEKLPFSSDLGPNESQQQTYFNAIVANGSFLAPTSSQLFSSLRALNHSPTLSPFICPLPVGVKNKLANVLRARRVFVWVVFDGAPDAGSDQSHAVRRASGVHVAPKAGEMVAKLRARSSTACQRTNERSGCWRHM